MLVEPLHLTTPIAAFNGGLVVDPDLTVVEQRTVPDGLVPEVLDVMAASGLGTWLYRGAEWYVTDPDGPHVAREAWTVKFDPTVVDDLGPYANGVVKVVGVSDDRAAMDEATAAVRGRFGDRASAAQSQPYYLDVTHPDANKGSVVRYLSSRYDIAPAAIATIGDMPNDVLMFAHSGLSIAMGNASAEVQRAARRVTTANDDEGFANAVERFVLPLA